MLASVTPVMVSLLAVTRPVCVKAGAERLQVPMVLMSLLAVMVNVALVTVNVVCASLTALKALP